MYNVLIVDDEPIVVHGMRMFVEASIPQVHVSEAYDGIEAMEVIRKKAPDIVLTDILMPEMDGLAFTRAVHEIAPGTLIVMCTGYSDFSYAQQALRLGVFDFLVKPVSFQKLHSVIQKALGHIEDRKQRAEEQAWMTSRILDQQIISALQGIPSEEVVSGKLQPVLMVVTALFVDNPKGLEVYMLKKILSEEIPVSPYRILMVYEFHRYILLFRFACNESPLNAQTWVKQVLEKIQLSVWKQYRFTLSAGISRPSSDYTQLLSLKHQALQMLQEGQLQGNNTISSFPQGREWEESPKLYEETRNYIFNALLMREPSGIDAAWSLLEKVLDDIGDEEQGKNFLHSLWVEILFLVNFPEKKKPSVDLFEGKSLAASSSEMKERLLQFIKEFKSQDMDGQKDIAAIVSNYIREHYAQDISLTNLSEELCYSTAYLSRLIHKNCKKSFVKMLIGHRMDKAKERLTTTNETVASIASEVGYKDVGYFITAFCHHQGCSPTEYRQKNMK